MFVPAGEGSKVRPSLESNTGDHTFLKILSGRRDHWRSSYSGRCTAATAGQCVAGTPGMLGKCRRGFFRARLLGRCL
jgi:hypothetical protein